MAEPPKPAALRNALRDAGVHIWIDTDDVLAAGRGYVMLHASSDGEKRIRLPFKSDIAEIFGASPPLKGVATITETMKLGETRVWKIVGVRRDGAGREPTNLKPSKHRMKNIVGDYNSKGGKKTCQQ